VPSLFATYGGRVIEIGQFLLSLFSFAEPACRQARKVRSVATYGGNFCTPEGYDSDRIRSGKGIAPRRGAIGCV
jgi:hypothetical protein